MNARRFRHGDHILVREVWEGKLWSARPNIVIADTPELLAMYMPEGTAWRRPATAGGGFTRIPAPGFTTAPSLWYNEAVRLAVPGEDHSVLLLWEPCFARMKCWYVNMETPLTRTAIGFDYMDHVLDIVVQPDFTAWKWKDEDEVVEWVQRGMLTQDRTDHLRREGLKALSRMEARESPFTEEWRAWRPDPSWQRPALPEGWDRL